jgi:hypothetical protein
VEGLNDARTKLADCFILLRYHGVFRQGKRGKALPARSIARIIRDGSSRNGGVARDKREERDSRDV